MRIDADLHTRRALRLEYATVAWNVGEAGLTIGLGIVAGSLALVGFGTDSIIELFASFVVIWHLSPRPGADERVRTTRALRLVAISFASLAIVLFIFSMRDLVT
ncbi:MAG: cation transporter, partial [Acidimicrobiia bacterium]|nr:cation transporter [Acidimicrobiia bacterium]